MLFRSVHVADLYPTILELAGINVAATQPAVKPIDGRSLLPVLANQTLGTAFGYAEQSGSTLTTAEWSPFMGGVTPPTTLEPPPKGTTAAFAL